MHELTGKLKDFSVDFKTGRANITLSINEKNELVNCYDQLSQEAKLRIKIDKYREKRSLNSNAYAWKLMTEIGNVLRRSKEEVYLDMLKHYGQREMVSVKAHIPIHQYIKYCEEAGESSLNGTLFKHYYVYKGSSEFDSREMSIFIDGVVDAAQELGIPTETPERIAEMKSLWGE